MTLHGKIIGSASAVFFALCVLAPNVSAVDSRGGYDDLLLASPDSLASQPVVTPPPSPSTAVPSVELVNFWEKLQKGVGDPICKKAGLAISHNQKFADDAMGLKGGVRRDIKRFPDGSLALLDEVKISLSAVLGEQSSVLSEMGELTNSRPAEAQEAAFHIGLSGRLEGKSQVVRPLRRPGFCREALEWVKFYELKTVVPATKKRIVKMEVGEIWKLPLSMRMSFNVGVGANIAQVVNISLSAGLSGEARPSVSLRRLDENQLRLRLRLDRIAVVSAGLTASSVQLPLDAVGLENAGAMAAEQLAKAGSKLLSTSAKADKLDSFVLREINKLIAAKLFFVSNRFRGTQLLLELILDLNNEEQMDSLHEFLRGDFGVIKRFLELGLKLNDFYDDSTAIEGMGGLEDVAEQAGGALDSEVSFAGTDTYTGRSRNVGVQLPLVGKYGVTRTASYHRYQALGQAGEAIHANQRGRAYNGSSLLIPFVGAFSRHNIQQDVYVLNKENVDGTVTRPVLLFQQYEGVVRRSDGTVEKMLEKVNGVLRYVGMNGSGVSAENQLPVNDIVAPSKNYYSAVVGFKFLITERGVQDIIFSPAQSIMKAYMNVMREFYADIIDKVMGLFTFDKKGAVSYDKSAAMRALGISAGDQFAQGCNPLKILDNLAYMATRVISDIAGVRDAPDWQAQSGRLSAMAGGASKSLLKYDDFLKVMVQLTRPENVSASVYVHLAPGKKSAADVTQTHEFFDTRSHSYDATIAGVTRMRERFATPAELSD